MLKYLRIAATALVLAACVLLAGLSVYDYEVDPVGSMLRAIEILILISIVIIPILSANSWRFSLRTLLIATTLVAVLLGIIVMAR